ncbi:F0F1 ATP synthase subunit B [Mycoplasma corogypsi]|uniref:F0F1 ATP synthase subunit B n=1 Tax=Mycoplasma corogypsi TaxID=2106 RepID=UPI003872BD5A
MNSTIVKTLTFAAENVEAASNQAANGKPLSLADKFETLFPSWPIIVATIIAFIIVFVFLTYFVYKPVKKMMKDRHDFIQGNIDEAIKAKEDSLEKLNEANESLKSARVQATTIINKAKVRADKVADFYTTKARAQSKRLLDETILDIQAQQREFEMNSKTYVVNLGTELATKILKREISQQTQDELINQYLNSDKDAEDI